MLESPLRKRKERATGTRLEQDCGPGFSRHVAGAGGGTFRKWKFLPQ